MDSLILIVISLLIQVIGSTAIVLWIFKRPQSTKIQAVYRKRQFVAALIIWPICSIIQVVQLHLIQPNISGYIESVLFTWGLLIIFPFYFRKMRGDFYQYWPSGEPKQYHTLQKNIKELLLEAWFKALYMDSRYMDVLGGEHIGRILEKDGIVKKLKDPKERQDFINIVLDEHKKEMIRIYSEDFDFKRSE